MNNATTAQTPDFRIPAWAVFLASVFLGWYGYSSYVTAQLDSQQTSVVRITDQAVDLPDFGLSITPTNGWTYLKVTGRDASDSMRLVHYPTDLIVVITPFLFEDWPPDLVARSGRIKDIDREFTNSEVVSESFEHYSVEWFMKQRLKYMDHWYGRIITEHQDFLVHVICHRGSIDERAGTVADLINQLVPTP